MVLIDVRTPEEFAERHADGAINLPVEDLMSGKLPDVDKDAEISTYCRSGARSDQAKQVLSRAGFTDVTNLGGLNKVLSNE